MSTIEAIKELRRLTNAPMGACKAALEESAGDLYNAIEILQRKSQAGNVRLASRLAIEGQVTAYQHHDGRSGCLLEVNCETDFVARTEAFADLVRNLCLQIVAMRPLYVSRTDVPADRPYLPTERVGDSNWIQLGLDEYYAQCCLLEQPYVKGTPGQTVGAYLAEVAATMGENIVVRRFACYELGEKL